jgi:hypothetical protein
MAKMKVSLHRITREIDSALRQMRAIRKKLSAKDKRKIALDIRELQRALKKVRKVCLPFLHGRIYLTAKK